MTLKLRVGGAVERDGDRSAVRLPIADQAEAAGRFDAEPAPITPVPVLAVGALVDDGRSHRDLRGVGQR